MKQNQFKSGGESEGRNEVPGDGRNEVHGLDRSDVSAEGHGDSPGDGRNVVHGMDRSDVSAEGHGDSPGDGRNEVHGLDRSDVSAEGHGDSPGDGHNAPPGNDRSDSPGNEPGDGPVHGKENAPYDVSPERLPVGVESLYRCPICESAGKGQVVISAADHLVSKEVFHVEQCPSCGFLYTNPRPNRLKIRDYYLSEAYISHAGDARSIVEWAYQGVRQVMTQIKIRLLKRYVKRGGEVLDIGCGTGVFLEALQNNGYIVRGFEPQETARMIARGKNLDVSSESTFLDDLPDQCLDGITMWHVLEHVHDLKRSLETYRRLLVPGGVLVLAVPIHTAFDAGFYGADWAAYDLPRHLYHFNRHSLQRLVGDHGFGLVSRKGLPFDSYYVSLLSEKQSGKLVVGLRQARALSIGMISNLYALSGKKPWSSEVFVFRKESKS